MWDPSLSFSLNKWAPPPVYTTYRCDEDDCYGGSIIIAKKNLIIVEIKTNQMNTNQLAAIKVESFLKHVTLKKLWNCIFMHYSCVVIVLFNMVLCGSVFSMVSFGKLFFRLSVFFVLNQMFWIKTLKYALSSYFILLCSFVLTL